jgi:hypothetical protein
MVSTLRHRDEHLELVPVTKQEVGEFIARVHRHHDPPQIWMFGVGITRDGVLCGVASVNVPSGQLQNDGYTLEVTRLATDGTPNACSMLYQACWKAASAMGYHRLLTYILAGESGTSLKASGWQEDGVTTGDTWQRTNRYRPDTAGHLTGPKRRFVKTIPNYEPRIKPGSPLDQRRRSWFRGPSVYQAELFTTLAAD